MNLLVEGTGFTMSSAVSRLRGRREWVGAFQVLSTRGSIRVAFCNGPIRLVGSDRRRADTVGNVFRVSKADHKRVSKKERRSRGHEQRLPRRWGDEDSRASMVEIPPGHFLYCVRDWTTIRHYLQVEYFTGWPVISRTEATRYSRIRVSSMANDPQQHTLHSETIGGADEQWERSTFCAKKNEVMCRGKRRRCIGDHGLFRIRSSVTTTATNAELGGTSDDRSKEKKGIDAPRRFENRSAYHRRRRYPFSESTLGITTPSTRDASSMLARQGNNNTGILATHHAHKSTADVVKLLPQEIQQQVMSLDYRIPGTILRSHSYEM